MTKQRESTRVTADQRKQEILGAAAKVFAAKGFRGATTAEIAREAGVSEGTIFRYFKTKKDLLTELAESLVVEKLKGVVAQTLGQKDEEVLKALIYDRLQLIKPNVELIRFLFYEAQFHQDIRQIIFNQVIFKAAEVMQRFFAGKVAEGVFRDIDSFVAIRSLVGMVFLYVLFDYAVLPLNPVCEAPGTQEERDRHNIDLIVDIFLNGVRARQDEK